MKLNENEFTMAKVRQDADEYVYAKEAYNMEDRAYNLLRLEDDQVKLRYKYSDNSKANEIVLNDEGVNLKFDTDSGEMSVQVREDSIEIVSGSTSITLKKDGDVEVNTTGFIKLNGDSNTGVLYEPLKEFINSVYNSHTHGTPSGPSSPPVSRYTQSQTMQSKSVKLT
jgi:hypothetical protein